MCILPCLCYFWQVSAACESVPSEPQAYRLVSVVEHFGRACGGHYTVYRSLQSESQEEHPDENCKPSPLHWFCISDSNVYRVSEEDVLAAEASLLFYERIIESWHRTNHTSSFWSCMSLLKQIFQSQSHVSHRIKFHSCDGVSFCKISFDYNPSHVSLWFFFLFWSYKLFFLLCTCEKLKVHRLVTFNLLLKGQRLKIRESKWKSSSFF